MDEEKILELLKRKPGYEVVYCLLDSDARRKELAKHAEREGGTLERWLKDAVQAGLVSKTATLDENNKLQARYSLEVELSQELEELVRDRGSSGPRESHSGFADVGAVHVWNVDH